MNNDVYNSLMEYAEEANAANPEPETVDFCLFEGRVSKIIEKYDFV